MFFVFPFYVVLAITFGGVDPILRQPVPAWNPAHVAPRSILQFTFSNIIHSDGLYYAAFINTFVFVGIATFLLPVDRVPVRVLPGAARGPVQGPVPGAVLRAVLDLLHAADARLDLAAAGRRLREQDPDIAGTHAAAVLVAVGQADHV